MEGFWERKIRLYIYIYRCTWQVTMFLGFAYFVHKRVIIYIYIYIILHELLQ